MTASRPLAYAREGVQLNREFPNAYQGKFFKEQGIGTLISGAAARGPKPVLSNMPVISGGLTQIQTLAYGLTHGSHTWSRPSKFPKAYFASSTDPSAL